MMDKEMFVPRATYRIQFTPSFGFDKGKEILEYLDRLGISSIYSSPILKAREGSEHGYDVVDSNEINPSLGGQEGFDSLNQDLHEKDMTWIQDIVPNHMAYSKENLMLMDIFEKREKSPYFHYFDIDWIHPFESFQGRVLAPFLGGFYSEILEKKEIQISYDSNGFSANYYELKFPILLSTYKDILAMNIQALEENLGKGNPVLIQFLDTINQFEKIFQEEKNDISYVMQAKNTLLLLYNENPEIKDLIDDNLDHLNGNNGKPYLIDELDLLLSKQCYRLSLWKVASEELNYRRFFTINELISVRVQEEEVFNETHKLILKLIKENRIQGLRIDHIDGLYSPFKYLANLRAYARNTYIVVEKILGYKERLHGSFDVQGTTGYDFMNYVNRVFCDQTNETTLTKIYYKFSKIPQPYRKLIPHKKKMIIGKHMAGDIDNLAHLMKKVAGHSRLGRDITRYSLKRALVEVVTFFPVYRTYITQDQYDEQDQIYIQEAIARAHQHAPDLEYELDFIKKFLSLELLESLTDEKTDDFWTFIMKFQQLTAPVMAKGFEDTVFYTYNKLLSLNEVGGEPSLVSVSLEDFYVFMEGRHKRTPHSFNASSTHDTKRGEDARARINVLSEIPDIWKSFLTKWSKINKSKKQKVENEYMPDANDEYLIYQALLGAYPFSLEDPENFQERVHAYIIKSVREAKVHTAWIKPDLKYEEACIAFVDKLLDRNEENLFFPSFQELATKVSFYGILNSLSQTLIKITTPGVPDFYQGTELWDLSFVDPDNRRPVDYQQRKEYLNMITDGIHNDISKLIMDLWDSRTDGRIKMFLIYQALHLRKRYEKVFKEGSLIPLEVKGPCSECVIAYGRCLEDQLIIAVIPRFYTRLVNEEELPFGRDVWQDNYIKLEADMIGHFTDAITHQTFDSSDKVLLADLLTQFPVALLYNQS